MFLLTPSNFVSEDASECGRSDLSDAHRATHGAGVFRTFMQWQTSRKNLGLLFSVSKPLNQQALLPVEQ